jgi:hydroxymethylbilane synthase
VTSPSDGPALRLGTRGSRLALWQAETVAARLEASGTRTEIVVITTTGDRSQTRSVPGDDSKRQFVKELEEALLEGRVDVCVHSAKDLPAVLPDGLMLSACLPREDPRDALVLRDAPPDLPWSEAIGRMGGVAITIGTGSVRRVAQLRTVFPAATFVPIRGNVDTRVGKLDSGGYEAIVLACAGLRRLGFGARISAAIPIDRCVPAPGQGIVATEIRAGDARTASRLALVHDALAGRALDAERALVAALGGGCQLPLGAIAQPAGSELDMQAIVTSVDGSQAIRRAARGPADRAGELGLRLAEALAAAGAGELLQP